MIETAENVAKDYSISREASDKYALMSHQRASAAWAAGKFDEELVQVLVQQLRGSFIMFATDEGVREDATMEGLATLRPLEKGVVTASNASQQNDAAAACLLVTEEKLKELGMEAMGYLVGYAAADCEPSRMGIGPVPAVE